MKAGGDASRLAWYVSRLRAMEASEVGTRARREIGARLDDIAWSRAHRLWQRRWEPPGGKLFVRPGSPTSRGPLTADRAELLRTVDPAAADRVVERAEEYLAGRYRLLGYPEVVLPGQIDFEHDPFTGRSWPDAHGKAIDFRSGAWGDPKWIWELNRHQDLPLLCLAWLLSGEERFGRRAAERLLTWLERFKPGRGIAWANAFEAALRGISFALAADALRASDLVSAAAERRILLGLWQHARFVAHDRSVGSSANNHLLGEAAGLAAIGLLAPELRDAERWCTLSLSLLQAEAERQILPDGGGAEQAFAYTLFDLDLLLLVAALLELQDRAVPEEIRAALARGADALSAQVRDDEPDPAYGDADNGFAFVLDPSRKDGSRGVAAALAACVGHGGARTLAGAPDATTAVLFGKAGLARFGAAASAPGPASAVLPETGLVVLRRAGVRVLCDVGPLGYLSLAAHGHADALQVTVTRGAVELVGDPGAGTYRDSDRRRAFRGTAFHATVEVDGADQAEQAGPFLWSRHYSATLRACDLERGFAVAEHTGYRRLPDPVLHTRAVLLLDDGSVVVLDRLEGGGSHRYVQRWPFHPAVEASLAGRTAVRATVGGRPQLTLWFGASCPGELGLERGREDPPAGWWSRALETFEPSWTAAHAVECAGAVSLAALLLVDGEQRADDPALRLRTEGTTTIVSFRHGQASHAIRLDPAATPPVVMSSSDAT